MGREGFTALIRGAVAGWGITRAHGPICARVFAALTDTEGAVTWSRRGLLRRVGDELGDLKRTRAQLRRAGADMVAVLDELGLSRLADIPGLTAVGAAAILAEADDPRRYDGSSSRAMLMSSDNASKPGQAHISRRGLLGLGWWRRAVGRCSGTTRDGSQVPGAPAPRTPRSRCRPGQARRRPAPGARVACAACCCVIYCMVVHDTSWDPAVASGAASRHDTARTQAEAA
jgi:hypothetical protein